MKIEKLQGVNIELTESISEYIGEKVTRLAKIVKRLQPAGISIEVGKPSEHHQKGDVFYAEFNATVLGQTFRATASEEDLYAAIDKVQEEIKRQIIDWRKREHSVGKRAARSFKKWMRFGRAID
ncbi:MAG: ribosome-associated translation inhibitor RaiA [Patescibacteria group bacterium]